MGEREMLELAAWAAGIELITLDGALYFKDHALGNEWRPQHDDGQALRLAVKLHLTIEHNNPADNDAWVSAMRCGGMTGPMEEVDGEDYRAAATRLAILRAAAEIGAQQGKGEGA